MEKVLDRRHLGDWVERLGSYRVYAPVADGDLWHYEVVGDPGEMRLDHPNTVHSPKGMVFPQREVLFEFEHQKGASPVIDQVLPDPQPSVVFGVRPCDARALTLTDKVFADDFEDPYYRARRNRAAWVGLSCNAPPSPACFCSSVGGSPHSEDGLDILMTELADGYFVTTLTNRGEEIVGSAISLFEDPDREAERELERVHAESRRRMERTIDDLEATPARLREAFESTFWDDESRACIQCGICTYLCPACHCFDINDEVSSSSPLRGRRVRTWDSCQFADFTMHSSGHNPRPDKASRMRQRICHKFLYFVERHHVCQCTGCGRCVSECPVGVDILAVVNRVAGHAR